MIVKRFLALFGLLLALATARTANAAIVLTDLGGKSGNNGFSYTFTAAVPAGSTIFAEVFDNSGTSCGPFADSINGAYTKIGQVVTNLQEYVLCTYYFPNSAAVSTSATIVYLSAGGTLAALGIGYLTGVAASPLDAATFATAKANSGTATITSGTPASSGDYFIASMVNDGGVNIANLYGQATGWSSIISGGGGTFSGFALPGSTATGGQGSIQGSGTSTVTWTASSWNGTGYATAVVGFKSATAGAGKLNLSLMGVGK